MNGWLLDQNLPARLRFAPKLPFFHASALGPNPTDAQLWAHARLQRFAIVTKDADFSARIIVESPPPWVVHLRFGNLRSREYHARLAEIWPLLESLLPRHKLVNVFDGHVETVG